VEHHCLVERVALELAPLRKPGSHEGQPAALDPEVSLEAEGVEGRNASQHPQEGRGWDLHLFRDEASPEFEYFVEGGQTLLDAESLEGEH
jgi:hypothetical protein